MSVFSEYGKALFLAAEEEGAIEEVCGDLRAVSAAVGENPDAVKLFDTPAISREEKHSLADTIFGSTHPLTVNTVKLMSDRSIFHGILAVAAEYFSLYDSYHGILRAEAVSAVPMSESQLAALTARLERVTGKRIILTNTVDSDILGGVILRYSGVQLDGSLKARLDGIERKLKNSVI